MAVNVGESTTLFEGELRRNGKHSGSSIDYVAINGFCHDGDREHWTTHQKFWLEDWLLEGNVRILLVSNRLNRGSSVQDLLHQGEGLIRVVEQYRAGVNVPLVFLCHGLGGIILLKALQISESRNTVSNLALTTAGVVFFGSPIAPQKLGLLKRTLQDCIAAELLVERHLTQSVEDKAAEEVQEVLKVPEICACEMVSIYETQELSVKDKAKFRFTRKRKVIVPKALASSSRYTCIPLDRDHHSIAQLDRSSFTNISQRIKGMIDRYLSERRRDQPTGGNPVPRLDTLNITDQDSNLSNDPRQSGEPDHPAGPSRSQPIPQVSATYDPQPPLSMVRESNDLNLPLHKIDFPKNPNFFGRTKYMRELDRCLAKEQESQVRNRAFAIYGTAGVGKSQTALKFAYDHLDVFPSILWVSSENKYKVLQSLSEYAFLLGVIPKQTEPVSDAEKMIQWYNKTATPWLLIFDNAVDVSLILDYWPKNPVGAILVTTQYPIFAGPDLCKQGRELLQLEEASAVEWLLSSISEAAITPDNKKSKLDAEVLIKRVGCLPVAIKTCIGQVNEAGCTLKDYNKEWNDVRVIVNRSEVKHVESLHARYDKSLINLLDKSYRSLKDDARTLLNIFSLLDDEHIPEELLENDSLFSELPFLKSKSNLLGVLLQISLIGKETESRQQSSRRFHIHRLVRTLIQMAMAKMDKDAPQAAFDAAAKLLNAKVTAKSVDFATNRDYFQHVQSLLDYYEATFEADSIRAEKPLVASCEFIQLLRKTSWWCYRADFVEPALRFMKKINAIHDEPETYPTTAQTLQCLEVEVVWNHYQHGAVQTELQNFHEGLRSFQRALDCRNTAEAKGYDGLPRIYPIYGGLGNSYTGIGRQIESEQWYRKCLDENPTTQLDSTYDINICFPLWQQGHPRLAEASKRLEDFIKRRAEAYGVEDTRDYLCGHAYYLLGNVRISQAKDPMATDEQREQWMNDAYNLHAKCCGNWEKTHGEGHHKTADAYVRYAWHLSRTDMVKQAISMLERALAIYQTAANREYRRREIARTKYKLGLAYEQGGRLELAQKYKDEAEKLRAEILGGRVQPAVGLESYDTLVGLWVL